ncbi:MAG: cache domain-containing protein [Patescibacteria group bacterium]
MQTKILNKIVDFLEKSRKKYWIFYFSSVLILAAPVVFVISYNYTRTSRELTELALSRRQTIAHLSAIMTYEKLERFTDIGVSLASRVYFRQLIQAGRPKEAMGVLKSISMDFPVVDSIFLLDPAGAVTAAMPDSSKAIGGDFSSYDWYGEMIQKWEPRVSDVYIHKNDSKSQYNAIAIATPIFDDNKKPIGILVLQMKPDVFLEWSKDIDVGPGALIYFVDKKRNIVAHPQISSSEKIVDFSNVFPVSKIYPGKSGIDVVAGNSENDGLVAAYEGVAKYDWGVVVQQPSSVAFAARDVQLRFLLIVYAVVTLFNLLISYFILRILYAVNLYRQREKVFMESIGDGVLAIDKEWNICLWNKAASEITGWSQEEAIGKPFRSIMKLIRAHDRKEDIVFIEETLLYGEGRKMENGSILITKDKKEISLSDSAAPIFDPSGKVSGVIIIFRPAS